MPLREIAARYADGGPNWFHSLRADVIADARARGLLQTRRLGTLVVFASIVGGMGLACAGLLPFQHNGESRGDQVIAWASVLGWFVIAPVIGLILVLRGPRALPHAPIHRRGSPRRLALARRRRVARGA